MYNYKDPSTPYVITCAHVLYRNFVYIAVPIIDSVLPKLAEQISDTIVTDENRIWIFDGHNFKTEIQLNNNSLIYRDTLNDIGIFNLGFPQAMIHGIDTLRLINIFSIPHSGSFGKSQVKLGAPLYFIGFPLGMGSPQGFNGRWADVAVNPLVRSGILAWKSIRTNQFLIDGVSWGGNSGSPVFTQPTMLGDAIGLIGMVQGHEPFMSLSLRAEPPINQQQRIVQDTTDLNVIKIARAIWIDDIYKDIAKFDSLNPKSAQVSPAQSSTIPKNVPTILEKQNKRNKKD